MGRAATLSDVAARLAGWGPVEVVRPLTGGHRNIVVLVRDKGGRLLVAKSTRRDEAALAWAARLQSVARSAGILTPVAIPAEDGRYAPAGMTVETHMEGRPANDGDLAVLRLPMARLRRATERWPQRPGFASASDLLSADRGGDVDMSRLPRDVAAACREAWRPLAGGRRTAIHGDLNTANLMIDAAGRPVLLDWDESRLDSPLFDLGALRRVPGVACRARVAWEVAAGWRLEPAYARGLSERLMTSLSPVKAAAAGACPPGQPGATARISGDQCTRAATSSA